MAIQKQDNIFCGMTVTATHIVDGSGNIIPLMNVTLQTGSGLVDTSTNNLVGSVQPGPAYQVPANVVQQFFTDGMTTLLNGQIAKDQQHAADIATRDANLKAAQDKATADAATAAQALSAAQTKAASDLQAAQTAAATDKAAAVKVVQDQLVAANADKAAITKQFTDLQSVCGLTDGGAALLAQQKQQAVSDALNASLATAKAMNIDVVAVATQAANAVQQVLPPTPEPPVRVQA